MDMESVRLVLNDGSTGVVAFTVSDALPLAEHEGLLDPGPVSERNASTGKACIEFALWPVSKIPVALHERRLEITDCNEQESVYRRCL